MIWSTWNVVIHEEHKESRFAPHLYKGVSFAFHSFRVIICTAIWFFRTPSWTMLGHLKNLINRDSSLYTGDDLILFVLASFYLVSLFWSWFQTFLINITSDLSNTMKPSDLPRSSLFKFFPMVAAATVPIDSIDAATPDRRWMDCE